MGQLGDTLRARRVQLGITISQAADHTKIRGKLLEALEAGDYARLPNPGYVRGYVSSYARFLELDSLPLIELYWKETGQIQNELTRPAEAVVPRNQQHTVPWRVALIAALVVILAAFGLWLALRPKTASQDTLPVPNSSQSPTSTAGSGATATTLVPFKLTVTIAANSASTVNVVVDGLSAYNGTLTGGQSKDFQVSQAATLTVGTPSAVTVTRDGTKVTVPSGSPATLALKAEKKQ